MSEWHTKESKVFRPNWKASHAFECANADQACYAARLLQSRDRQIAALRAKAALAESLMRRAVDGLANSFHSNGLDELLSDVDAYDALTQEPAAAKETP